MSWCGFGQLLDSAGVLAVSFFLGGTALFVCELVGWFWWLLLLRGGLGWVGFLLLVIGATAFSNVILCNARRTFAFVRESLGNVCSRRVRRGICIGWCCSM